MKRGMFLAALASSCAIAVASACTGDDPNVVVVADSGTPPPVPPGSNAPPPNPPPGPGDAGGDADAGPYCASHAGNFYCQDFESVPSIGGIAGGPLTQGGATITIETAMPVAGAKSLHAFADGTMSPQQAMLQQGFATTLGNPTSVTVEADMKCQAAGMDLVTAGFGLITRSGSDSELHHVMILISSNQTQINEGYSPADGGPFVGYPGVGGPSVCGIDVRHVAVTIDRNAMRATLFVDGATIASLTLTPEFKFLASSQLQMGIGFAAANAAVQLDLDNVLVTKN